MKEELLITLAQGQNYNLLADSSFGVQTGDAPPSFSSNTTMGDLSFVQITNLAVAIAIIFAAGLSVFYIFVGGISFILSGGQEDKIKQAVHTIRYAIIGLIVTIFAVTMIAIIGSIFNFNLVSYLSWDKITEMMRMVIGRLTESDVPTNNTLD